MWNGTLTVETRGAGHTVDLTPEVERLVSSWGVGEGLGTCFVPGSTAGLTTIEFEPGVVRDLAELLERLAPAGVPYHHDRAWGDGNGYAHVRAALLGPDLSFLVRGGRVVRGTWQQFVLCDFDNRPRTRRVEVQVIGTPTGEAP
ncbi:MAG: YjbQ family protein [Candidatus Dadabacteria bacterium]|nr:MAG: YjbQ family protein [Candidatus Dadabacteria bacterium]